MLKMNNVTKTRKDFYLENISMTLSKGYIMGLIGTNGSGKTTLMQLMMNLLKLDSGEIKIFGLDHRRDEVKIKEDIGFVYDQSHYPQNVPMREVAHWLEGFYAQWDKGEYARLMDLMELNEKKKIRELSKGMSMKFSIVMALCHHAKLIIMDEPTAGLDPVVRREVLQLFREYLADGEKSLIYSTHITSDLESVADYITMIDDGKLLYTGTQDELKDSHHIIPVEEQSLSLIPKEQWIGRVEREGLIKGQLPEGIESRRPSLEDVMFYYKKGGKRRERSLA